MTFDRPKGQMQFQAREGSPGAAVDVWRSCWKNDPADSAWAVPVLTREFTIDDMKVPVANKR